MAMRDFHIAAMLFCRLQFAIVAHRFHARLRRIWCRSLDQLDHNAPTLLEQKAQRRVSGWRQTFWSLLVEGRLQTEKGI